MTLDDKDDMIRQLELLTLETWPPHTVERMGNWVLALDQGISGRANAVYPLGLPEPGNLASAIEEAEGRYRRDGLIPRFKMTQASRPGELEAALEDRGYVLEKPSATLVASVDGLLDTLPTAWPDVDLADCPMKFWAETIWAQDPAEREGRATIVSRVTTGQYALVRMGGAPAGGAMVAVSPDGWMVINAVAIRPKYRRLGLARRVIAALVDWARTEGALSALLQVERNNEPALALYADVGFEKAYDYHYRVRY